MSWKRWTDPLFLGYLLCWGIIHLCRAFHVPTGWLNNHLTDFIAVPVMAHISAAFIAGVIVRRDDYHYPLGYLLFIALYTSVVFEGIMPRLSSVYTGDWMDVAAYFAGALFYYFVHIPILRKGYQHD
ncbi:hypothetical protein [Chitinophaga sp. Cy-1792]|uniref:hypothetical protein n=1 Tax=Chitinophaga sp. Cy-1792 TaxID=2608339 RepID=UPI0014204DCD|nr:hypothetical protein [Chitinophaga sp. Cy-1792]NIG54035.1 hypothetical protein [Chitinophaga sp. Cy-1792]